MPHRYIYKKVKRFLIYRVLHVDDTPHRIALGLAVGVFMAWTPLMGLQMILTVAVSAILRANKLVGVPFVYISNPVTLVPIYGFSYLVGAWMIPGSQSLQEFIKELDLATKAVIGKDGLPWWESFYEGIRIWWAAMVDFFWPLLLGCTLLGIVMAVASYFVTRRAVVAYRRHRSHRLEIRAAAAARRAERKAKALEGS